MKYEARFYMDSHKDENNDWIVDNSVPVGTINIPAEATEKKILKILDNENIMSASDMQGMILDMSSATIKVVKKKDKKPLMGLKPVV